MLKQEVTVVEKECELPAFLVLFSLFLLCVCEEQSTFIFCPYFIHRFIFNPVIHPYFAPKMTNLFIHDVDKRIKAGFFLYFLVLWQRQKKQGWKEERKGEFNRSDISQGTTTFLAARGKRGPERKNFRLFCSSVFWVFILLL